MAAAFSTGWLYPWIAHHQDDMPSISRRPSQSSISQPLAERTGYIYALTRWALNTLDGQGHDFSQYDANGDGYIDAVNVFYAGSPTGGWSVGLWPHSGGITWYADGVETYRYQITNIGGSLNLSTFCHENGHMIMFWPDLYDYGYESSGVFPYLDGLKGRLLLIHGMAGSSRTWKEVMPLLARRFTVIAPDLLGQKSVVPLAVHTTGTPHAMASIVVLDHPAFFSADTGSGR